MTWIRHALRAAPVAVLALSFAPGAGLALPLFSRDGGPPCRSCHLDSPRLSPAGIRFLERGYRGGDSLAVFPTHTFPVSVTARLGVRAERSSVPGAAAARSASAHRSIDDGISLESAGALGTRFSYQVSLDGSRAGDGPRASRAHLQFDDLLSRDRLNLRVGSYDADLPFLSAERNPTLHPYLAPVGLWARGLELNGGLGAWRYGGALIHSSRSASGPDPDTGPIRSLEDTYWMLSHQAGAASFGARILFDRQDSSLPSLTWMQHLQALVGGAITRRSWAIAPAYVFDRFDDRPAAGIHDRHQFYLLEATLVPGQGRWALNARAEHEYRTRTVWTPEEDHQMLVLNLARVLNPLARIAIEGSASGDNIGGPRSAMLGAYVWLQY
jgi:hypothetical protein